VRAGLGLVEQSRHVSEVGRTGFSIRVGMNTGLVAVGGQTKAEDTLVGTTVHLAKRMESAAPVGGVLISHETWRHVRGLFDIQESEPVTAKGFTEPVRAYVVLRAKARSFHQPLRGVEGLETRMVGREAELKYLQEALLNTLESCEGQVITVSGEAGVGKSRLVEEFQNWVELRPEHILLYQGRGSAEGQAQPNGLLRDVFADRFEILEDDSPNTVREKFVLGLQQGLIEEAEMKAHLLGQMLGYDFSNSPHLKGVLGDGEQLHNRGMMYLGEYFIQISRREPVVMLLEDVHWADDSTLDVVGWLEQRMRKLRMLVVCAGRETLYQRRPYWGEGEERHTRVSLKPLTKRESLELVLEILRRVAHLPDILRELIVEGAEGNPFYLEELIKMLIEDGVIVKGEIEWRVELERLQETSVPSTLSGVLQARLDSLPPEERKVLQEASVVGRQFWDRVVAYLHSGGKPVMQSTLLQERLSSLRGRELIFRREASAFAETHEYLFKHDLLRDVTYESVLKKVRRAHHSLVADWLIANVGDRTSEYAGLISEHLVLAGREQEAVEFLLKAGEAAQSAYSNLEAENFFRRVLDLKPNDPQQAMALQRLGLALQKQGKSEEATQMLRQAIELCRKLHDQDGLAQNIYELSRSLLTGLSQDPLESWPACQQGLKELEAATDSPGLARLLSETGRAAFFTDQPIEVITAYCQPAIEMAKRLELLEVQLDASITLGIANLDIDESISILERAATQAEANNLLPIAARACFNLDSAYCFKYDFINAQVYLRKSIELNRKIGANWQALSGFYELVADSAQTGNLKEISALVREFLDGVSFPEERLAFFHSSFAYIRDLYMGEWAQGLERARLELAQARQRVDTNEIVRQSYRIVNLCIEQFYLLGQGDLSEAETALRESIDIRRENPIFRGWLFQDWLAQILILQGRLEEGRLSWTEPETIWGQKNSFHKDHEYTARYFLAKAEGRWDEALMIAQSLVDRFEGSGATWYQARYRIYVGDALRGRDDPGDRERARQVYREALDIFTKMGADGYSQALQERLETLPMEQI